MQFRLETAQITFVTDLDTFVGFFWVKCVKLNTKTKLSKLSKVTRALKIRPATNNQQSAHLHHMCLNEKKEIIRQIITEIQSI